MWEEEDEERGEKKRCVRGEEMRCRGKEGLYKTEGGRWEGWKGKIARKWMDCEGEGLVG